VTVRTPPRLVVLISGTGRNLQAIMDAISDGRLHARLAAVISDQADAYGLERARRAGIPALTLPAAGHSRETYNAALAERIDAFDADHVALAGFMRILGHAFVTRYRGRMLNIHPSLLPEYRGLHTHERVLAAGERWHGASVHFVTDELDGGPVVLQGRVPVRAGDDAETLARRVMSDVEVRIYPLALAWLVDGRLTLRGSAAWLDGERLEAPRQLDEPDMKEAARR